MATTSWDPTGAGISANPGCNYCTTYSYTLLLYVDNVDNLDDGACLTNRGSAIQDQRWAQSSSFPVSPLSRIPPPMLSEHFPKHSKLKQAKKKCRQLL